MVFSNSIGTRLKCVKKYCIIGKRVKTLFRGTECKFATCIFIMYVTTLSNASTVLCKLGKVGWWHTDCGRSSVSTIGCWHLKKKALALVTVWSSNYVVTTVAKVRLLPT